MKKFKFCLMVAALLTAGATGFISCSDDDNEGHTDNPALEEVKAKKTKDTAVLLISFGSTYNEATHVYDQIVADFKSELGSQADVYLSFSSNTCIGRLEAQRGEAYYHLKDWLGAFAEAGYKRIAVQSLHVIPGEEYLDAMNGKVKKDFMIRDYPSIDVLCGANLLSTDEDTKEVARVLYNHYKEKLTDKKNIVLFMGHGNPDDNYNANQKYQDVMDAMNELAPNKNVIVGTVDYGPMLFWPLNEETEEFLPAPNPECVYSRLQQYLADNNLTAGEVTIYMAPFMSIAGDHAHNDMWGIEDGDGTTTAEPNEDAPWRFRLQGMGFKVSTEESHPESQADADHGIKEGCGILALGDYPEIRKIWLKHLTSNWNNADAWQNGMDYQPE